MGLLESAAHTDRNLHSALNYMTLSEFAARRRGGKDAGFACLENDEILGIPGETSPAAGTQGSHFHLPHRSADGQAGGKCRRETLFNLEAQRLIEATPGFFSNGNRAATARSSAFLWAAFIN